MASLLRGGNRDHTDAQKYIFHLNGKKFHFIIDEQSS